MSVYPLLDRLEHDNISSFSEGELSALAEELRSFLVEKVSKTGGHLASNLGIVEISIALQLCFDPSADRIVYDVGHQCYIHKILNGRRANFDTLRTFGGISGFMKPSESECDSFQAGHSSTSVSVALGIARAMRLRGEKNHVVVVIGDGALTGGLAYEALNDAGSSGEPLIVILNDNGMSITKNVGALAGYLSRIRIRNSYLAFKRVYHAFFDHVKFAKPLDNFLTRMKNAVKEFALPTSFFEDMGFLYYGPYDGHDVPNLRYQFEAAKRMNRPVLLHLKTIKGKGYGPAEKNPNEYHGVSPFDPKMGVDLNFAKRDYSTVAGEILCELAAKDARICAITAAMPLSTGLTEFSRRFPERYFDVGIAEAHAVAMAAGLASRGFIPVFAVYSTFLQRSYDQLIHDIGIGNRHAVLLIDRAGLVGEDGETHHGVFDIGFLSQIPGMTVYSPANEQDLRECIRRAVCEEKGPVAVRYPKVSCIKKSDFVYEDARTLREGKDVTIVTYGRITDEVLRAADMLASDSISPEIIQLNRVIPFDGEVILSSVRKTGRIAVVEEVNSGGGLGEKLGAALMEGGVSADLLSINLGDRFIPQGRVSKLFDYVGISSEFLYRRLRSFLENWDEA